MRKLMWLLVALITAPLFAIAEPQRIEDPEPECDNIESTAKPPCKTDGINREGPIPQQSEGDHTTVPPDIPAEGLPHQNQPSPDGSPVDSQSR